MANAGNKVSDKKEKSLIDPIYDKFVKSVVRSIGSTEFYEFFMDAISKADNEFQFSNRKMAKTIDLSWVDAIEETLEAMQTIISNPRNVIKEEELIVNVSNAKKSGSETVRHLAQHSALIDDFNEERGDVRPGRLMQRYREESIGIYENRLVFTTIERAYQFVKKRHDALLEAMSDEFGAKLKIRSDMDSAIEHVHLDMFLHIKEIDDPLKTDEKNEEVFSRISRMYRILSMYMNTDFSQQLSKLPRVKGTPTKTNVLKKNKNYRKITDLWEFLRQYDDVGYSIKIIEQNPHINEQFERDIYRNILFNYLILKGYLEDEKDRQIPTAAKGRKRTLRPKFIREIIEELTEDYDLPDVEVRKVLIEELTKAQLMKEEAEERRRLVEEQAQRKKEEAERLRAEKEAEKERIRREKEEAREQLRKKKEAEEERLRQERNERDIEDRRRSALFRKAIKTFEDERENQLMKRLEEREKALSATLDFADAVALMEEAETRRKEEAARERQRRKEERERKERERILAERLAREEEERKEKERLEKEERERIEREAREAKELEEQTAKDREALEPVISEITAFMITLPDQKELRRQQAERVRLEEEERERRRRERQAKRANSQ